MVDPAEVRHPEPVGDEGSSRRLRVGALVGRGVVDADGHHVGTVLDVRVVQDGPVRSGMAGLRVDGLVVGDGQLTERFGLFRHEVRGPWLLKRADRILGPRRRYLRWVQVVDVDGLLEGDPLRYRGELSEELP